MEMLNHIALLVKCPHCGNKFSPEDAIQHDLRAKFEREFEQKLTANTKSMASKIQQEEQAKYKVQLQRLEALLTERKLTLNADGKAKEWLAEAGYDPVYGARPLKRVIQRELQNPLATMILEGRFKPGETISVSAGAEGLTIGGEKLVYAAAATKHVGADVGPGSTALH